MEVGTAPLVVEESGRLEESGVVRASRDGHNLVGQCLVVQRVSDVLGKQEVDFEVLAD